MSVDTWGSANVVAPSCQPCRRGLDNAGLNSRAAGCCSVLEKTLHLLADANAPLASAHLFVHCNSQFSTRTWQALSRNNFRLHHSHVAARDMSNLPDCPVCSKIMNIFKTAIREHKAVQYELGKLSDVINMPCPHSGSFQKLWESGRPRDMPTPETWSVEICSFVLEPAIIGFFDGERKFDYEVDLVTNEAPGHPGTAILLDSQWIDPSVPEYWFSNCFDEHGPKCETPNWKRLHPGTNADPDWLIDVIDHCIVPFSSDTSIYVTLSYTWGNVQCLKTTTGNLKQLRKAGSIHSHEAPNIPRTVQDAIKVTEYLGERYLWVDSLCIVQDDKESLLRNLNVMHRIYANSALCIVAYAGKDANYGLRGLQGISGPRHVEQSTVDIASGERLSYFNKSHGPIYSTVSADDSTEPVDKGLAYSDRGWTFQEFIFAKRRLIFTDGPLRWLCQECEFGEETSDYLDRDGWTHRMTRTYWVDDRLPSLEILKEIVSEYNERHFTYQNDILGAFLGIQSHLDGIFQGGLNYGHPEMFFDTSLAWPATWGVKRRIAPADASPDESQLPSWSWMGWHGGFYFDGDWEYSKSSLDRTGFTESVAQWFAMRFPSPSPLNMRPVHCKWHHYKTLFERDPSQVPDGWEVYTATSGSTRCRVVSGSGTGSARYPVPIPSSTESIKPIEQLRFLFSKTTRCHFATKPVAPSLSQRAKLSVQLSSTDGQFAGFLQLHEESDVDRFLGLGIAELVAVVKGWTTELDDFLMATQEHEKLTARQSPAPTPQQSSPYLEPDNKTRHICYFVLCIQWVGGVAKRRASGKVLAEVWDNYQEPVDLILG